jgi:hypothetical protein
MTRAQNVGFEEHVWWQESMPLKREGEMMFLVQLLPPTFCIFFLPFNLAKLSETDYMDKSNNYEYLWGSLDIKDAFLQVVQKETLRIKLGRWQDSNQN